MACRRSPVRSRLAPPLCWYFVKNQAKVLPASPSSRGLGHYPFTVATGVRIPVGTPLQNARASGRSSFPATGMRIPRGSTAAAQRLRTSAQRADGPKGVPQARNPRGDASSRPGFGWVFCGCATAVGSESAPQRRLAVLLASSGNAARSHVRSRPVLEPASTRQDVSQCWSPFRVHESSTLPASRRAKVDACRSGRS